ncbi:interferon gamma receptor 2 [Acanthopagrus latus]|uniref:interferon gamma receptor 2 n=1 Tax=Acanthopagrus latus TaxID=8177 RepID=UPI00187C0EF0|nr:interferon gamma receptor 2 [Acanthopagrus latus]
MLVIALCVQLVARVLCEVPPAPPQNIHVDNWLLKWTPGTKDTDVTYTVKYSSFDSEKWMDVPACVNISSSSCDVTSLKAVDELGCVKLHIQAERRGLRSRPVEACSNHTDSCTPEVVLTAQPGVLMVHLSSDNNLTREHADNAKHRVYYGKEGERLKSYIDSVASLPIDGLQEGDRYCVKVQYIYHSEPVGLPSCTQCELIPEPKSELSHAGIAVAVVVPVACVFVLGLLMAYVLIFHCEEIKRLMQPPCQIPTELFQFTSYQHHPVPTSPCEEQFDVITCITPE